MSEKDEALRRLLSNRQSSGETVGQTQAPKDMETSNEVKRKKEKTANQEAAAKNSMEASERVTSPEHKDTVGSETNRRIVTDTHDRVPLDEAAEKAKMRNTARNFKRAGIAAIGVIGLGTILDIKNELNQEQRTERMKRLQEDQIIEKQKREDKILAKGGGYNYVDMGQIVTEMFDSRIGHHKMGNSKFQ